MLARVAEHAEYTVALPFALMGATLGCLTCYMLSFSVLRGMVLRRFPARVAWLQNTVKDADNVFFFVLSLRLSPMVPSYFLNIAMPFAPVEVWQWALATVIGSIPGSMIQVEAGAAIARLDAGEDVLRPSAKHVAILLTLTVFAMAPYVLKKWRNGSVDVPDFKKMPS